MYNEYYEKLYTTVELFLPVLIEESSQPPPRIIGTDLNSENILTISFTEKMILPRNIETFESNNFGNEIIEIVYSPSQETKT